MSGIYIGKLSFKFVKPASWLIILYFHIAICNLDALGIAILIAMEDLKLALAYFLLPNISFLLWYLIFRRRKNISKIVDRIYSLCNLLRLPIKKVVVFINVASIAIVALPFILTGTSYSISRFKNANSTFWSYGYKVEDPKLNSFLIVIGSLCSNTFYVYIPTLVSMLFCTLCCLSGRILRTLRKRLEVSLLSEDTVEITKLAKEFFRVTNLLISLRNVFSTPLLALLAVNFLGMFTALSNAILKKIQISWLIYMIVNPVIESMIIIWIVLSGSQISRNMEAIKTTAIKLLNKLFDCPEGRKKLLSCMNRIENTPILHMTAGEVFTIEYGFILGVLGSLLTYGLLLINLK